jgi:hypothetical protein
MRILFLSIMCVYISITVFNNTNTYRSYHVNQVPISTCEQTKCIVLIEKLEEVKCQA